MIVSTPLSQDVAGGILVVDKPPGPTSHDVVVRVRRLFPKRTKVGHLGTLDPFACGVLPICVGKATRLAQFLDQGEKIYRADLQFGRATDTGDWTGKTVSESTVSNLDSELLASVVSGFQSTWEQKPPSFSACKVRGKPMYAYAREGIEVEGRARPITVYEIKVTDVGKDCCRLYLRCSPGVYVRAIADEIGKKLGYGAHLTRLQRLFSAGFGIEQTIPGGMLFEPHPSPTVIGAHIVPIDCLLQHLLAVTVSEEGLRMLQHGMSFEIRWHFPPLIPSPSDAEVVPPIRLMTPDGHLAALGRLADDPRELPSLEENQSLRVHPFLVLM